MLDDDKLTGAVLRLRHLSGRIVHLERADAMKRLARADAEGGDGGKWEENKHPRASDGRFGSKPGEHGGGAEPGKGEGEAKGEGPPPKAGKEEPAGKPSAKEGESGGKPAPAQGGKEPAAKEGAEPGAPEGKGAAGGKGGGNSGFGRVHPDHFSAAHFAYSHDDANASAESVLKHFSPDVARQVEEYKSRAMAATPTAETHKDDRGNYTPERRKLHEDIMFNGWTDKDGKKHDGILSEARIKAATPKPGEKPTFTILGGRGGSGKSAFDGKKHPEVGVYDPGKSIVLDSDEIKKALPEYEGWNANQVHEESGDIFDAITAQAAAMGLNLVHDATMKTPDKAVDLVKGFKDKGYGIEAHYMHLPRQIAAKRAVERFLGKTRRLVPPEVVLSNVKNEAAFDDVKKLADNWSFWDNNVGKDDPPKLISRSMPSERREEAGGDGGDRG